MAYGYYLEAEYESGYVHREDDQDHSPYVRHANIFNDILERRPEAAHGPLTRVSLIGPTNRYDIDWTSLPANARPIYLRHMEHDFTVTGEQETRMVGQQFGYQYNDESGHNHKEITEVS